MQFDTENEKAKEKPKAKQTRTRIEKSCVPPNNMAPDLPTPESYLAKQSNRPQVSFFVHICCTVTEIPSVNCHPVREKSKLSRVCDSVFAPRLAAGKYPDQKK